MISTACSTQTRQALTDMTSFHGAEGAHEKQLHSLAMVRSVGNCLQQADSTLMHFHHVEIGLGKEFVRKLHRQPACLPVVPTFEVLHA